MKGCLKHSGTYVRTQLVIRITCPCFMYPLIPHFYIVKVGNAGVYLFFLFLLQNIDCGYSLEPPRRGGSNVYPQSMFWAKIRKISKLFYWNFQFLQFKKSLFMSWASFRNGNNPTKLCSIHSFFFLIKNIFLGKIKKGCLCLQAELMIY